MAFTGSCTPPRCQPCMATEYTQSDNCRFLAHIPSWWKNQLWSVGVRGARPPPFSLFTITNKDAVYTPAERADTIPVFQLYPYTVYTQWPWLQRRRGGGDSYPHYPSGFGPPSSHSRSFLSGYAPHCSSPPPAPALIYPIPFSLPLNGSATPPPHPSTPPPPGVLDAADRFDLIPNLTQHC